MWQGQPCMFALVEPKMAFSKFILLFRFRRYGWFTKIYNTKYELV